MYKKKIISIILLLAVLAIHFFSQRPILVEKYYASGLYPIISIFLRSVFGLLPFSLGDCLYALVAFFLMRRMFFKCRSFFIKNKTEVTIQKKKSIYSWFIWIAGIYLVFNIFWGINYNRLGVAHQLGMKINTYDKEDLKKINLLLCDKINESKLQSLNDSIQTKSTSMMYKQAANAYSVAAKKYSFLKLNRPLLKTSLWGWLGNYLGFAGYYNPFTGESQVNTQVPNFLQPYIACHELGHQLGYAKEMEANFVGYLVARESQIPSFQYAAYLQLFGYANSNLYTMDSVAAKQYRAALLPSVKADLVKWRQYNIRYSNPIEPIVSWLYGLFLKGNQQPQGILSYDRVTAFLIAFYKKYGMI